MNNVPDPHLDTILIVEDDAIIRRMLEVSLERAGGYRVLSAEDGEQGLQRAIEDRPDALILDLSLPGMNGLDLMQDLVRRNLTLPTVIITAHTDATTIIRAFRLGAKNLLPKPFSVRDLQETLERTLSEARLARQAQELTAALNVANRGLQRQVRNWEVLNDIAQGMITLTDEREIYRRVVANTSRILDVQGTAILLLDESGTFIAQELTVLPSSGAAEADSPGFRDVRIELAGTVAGWVVAEGRPLLVDNTATDPRFRSALAGRPGSARGTGPWSVVCVPLQVQQRVIGVLEVLKRAESSGAGEPSDFTAQDLDIMRILASWVTFAIENVRLGESRQKMAAARTLAQTVVTLAHHVNNQLMACFLELDRLRWAGASGRTPNANRVAAPRLDAISLTESTNAIQTSLNRIQEVIQALSRLQDVPTVRYVGETEMIDLDAVLNRPAPEE
jgi:DNA-binding response OmpR family regulator